MTMKTTDKTKQRRAAAKSTLRVDCWACTPAFDSVIDSGMPRQPSLSYFVHKYSPLFYSYDLFCFDLRILEEIDELRRSNFKWFQSAF